MLGGKLYITGSKNSINIPSLAIDSPVEYPRQWFNTHQTLPTLSVLISKTGTLPLSRSAMCHLIRGTLVTPSEITEYLYRAFQVITATLSEDWTSYGQTIEKGVITPLHLLKVKTVERLTEVTSRDVISHDNPDVDLYILIMLAGLYRYSLCPEQQKEAVSNKVETVAVTYRPSESDPICLTSFHANQNLLKDHSEVRVLFSALDMFLDKFPDHPYGKVRIGTIVLRYAGCSALADVTYFARLLATKTLAESITWFFVPSLTSEVTRLLGQEDQDELQIKNSFFPYLLGMHLSTKSPYSANNNPNVHLLVHGVGSLLHSTRSLNARLMNDTSLASIAVNIAIVYLANKGVAPVAPLYHTEGRVKKFEAIQAGQIRREERAKATTQAGVKPKAIPLVDKGKEHPDEWAVYYAVRNCVFTLSDKAALQKSIDCIGEDKGKTKVFVSNLETSIVSDSIIVDTLIKNISNWNKLIRVVAFVRRFLYNYYRDFEYRNFEPLSTKELLHSQIVIIKRVQFSLFSFEISLLKKKRPLPKRNKLVSLSPFLDSFGVLRVGGRIQESTLNYDQKHPIILCKTHPISELIATYKHKQYLHSGVTLTFSLIQTSFHIIGCRNLIRKIVHKCVVCFRQRVATSQQLMGNLPVDRVIYSRPFSKVGCDYAGPITLRSTRLRNPKFIKAYIALFVCFVTKGIHLELVGDLSTNAFLLALDRFVARRGKPSEIWSDNATNFHGAKRTLDEMYNQLLSQHHNTIVADHLSKDNITWKFIPPAAPHFGGLWEAGVKSVKTHLKRVIGDSKLTYEEMYTLLTKIEALLNSRPMWHVSDAEPTALSPSHFMIGEQYIAIPQSNISNNNIKTNWFALQTLFQGFWKRWHQEYLTSLQHRPKWQQRKLNLQVNDVVLLKEPNLPPSKWIIGRILQVHPGKDGEVRVVTVHTNFGTYTRPISKVAPLPSAERPESSRGG